MQSIVAAARYPPLYQVGLLQVAVQDTVGCGDSFAAGIVLGYIQKQPLEPVLALSNAVGAATATSMGAGRNVASATTVRGLLSRQASSSGSNGAPWLLPPFLCCLPSEGMTEKIQGCTAEVHSFCYASYSKGGVPCVCLISSKRRIWQAAYDAIYIQLRKQHHHEHAALWQVLIAGKSRRDPSAAPREMSGRKPGIIQQAPPPARSQQTGAQILHCRLSNSSMTWRRQTANDTPMTT